MGDKSGIEWTDATWNPVTGCTKVSAGCKNCYAEALWPKVYGKSGRAFTDLAFHPERLDQPLRWKRPRMVFVNSMSDLFHEKIELDTITAIFTVMALSGRHQFQVLTKRPERMRDVLHGLSKSIEPLEACARKIGFSFKFSDGGEIGSGDHSTLPWPIPNVWLGVSVENQETADERIPILLDTPAALRFVSYEPALGPVDFMPWIASNDPSHDGAPAPRIGGLDWLICGGESGVGARPMHPDWARSARDQCEAAGVAYFFKQWGAWSPGVSYAPHVIYLRSDGAQGNFEFNAGRDEKWGPPVPMGNVGKKAAGSMLDGQQHKEMPAEFQVEG